MSLRGWSSGKTGVYTVTFEGGPHNGMDRTWIAEEKVSAVTRTKKGRPVETIQYQNNEYELVGKRGRAYVYKHKRSLPNPYERYGGDPERGYYSGDHYCGP